MRLEFGPMPVGLLDDGTKAGQARLAQAAEVAHCGHHRPVEPGSPRGRSFPDRGRVQCVAPR